MGRVDIDILAISELKWTGMGKFNSDYHYLYYCGQESLRRNGVTLIANKWVQNVVLGCNLKNDRIISVHFQGKPFNITVIQVYAPTADAEEAEVDRFCEDIIPRTNTHTHIHTHTQNVLFIIWDWNAKAGSQEITWNDKQVWPCSTKWSRVKANRILSRKHTGQCKRWVYISPDGQY